ncbi:hypothetical protein B0H14DRAFT_3509290 [Mycena olivaceomarginata]|nr:hypothetical protein B0H14DRAFT_3509290 [Mycena olivaceomarginata]
MTRNPKYRVYDAQTDQSPFPHHAPIHRPLPATEIRVLIGFTIRDCAISVAPSPRWGGFIRDEVLVFLFYWTLLFLGFLAARTLPCVLWAHVVAGAAHTTVGLAVFGGSFL